MEIYGVEVPDELIDAIKENKLVIFAGAGVSKGAPANLPNFIELCQKIARSTKEKYDVKNDIPDRFLGKLKSIHNIDVHNKTCQYIRMANQPNPIHSLIIKLFNNKNVKIITTNYDTLFEKTFENNNEKVRVYDNPALPFGDDFTGLIHVHGNVNEPKNIIVTDEDFGRAYMSDGQVSRFLVKVFENYHVLFVGYSYNDVIVQYLTRALFKNDTYNRYVLTDKNDNWELLGIKTIKFPKERYDVLNEVIDRIGDIANSNYTDWEKTASEIAYNINDKSSLDLLKYNIKDVAKLKLFLKYAEFSQWHKWFDENSYFNNFFIKEVKFSDNDYKILEWFVDNFKDNYDICKQIMAKHNFYNAKFVSEMLWVLIDKELDDTIIKEISMILMDSIPRYDFYTYHYIDKLFEMNIDYIAIELLKREFEPVFRFEENIIYKSNSSEYKLCHKFYIDNYNIREILKKYKSKIVDHKYDFALHLIQILERLHSFYEGLGLATNESEPYPLLFVRLEGEDQYTSDEVYVDFCEIISGGINNYSPIKAKMIMKRCFNSSSSILRKIGLISIRETDLYTDNEKMFMLLEEYITTWHYEKEYIFKLVGKIYDNLNDNIKNQFYNRITKNENSNDKVELYEIYNWAVWICNKSNNPGEFITLKDKFAKEYNFAPREHPELDFYISKCGFIEDKSEFTIEELRMMSTNKLVEYINVYDPQTFDGPNRRGFINVLIDLLTTDYDKLNELLTGYHDFISVDNDLWGDLIYALSKSSYSSEQLILIIKILTDEVMSEYSIQIFRLINSIIQKSSLNEENEILTIIKNVNVINNNENLSNRELDSQYLNSATGEKIECYFSLLSKDKTFNHTYKDIFKSLLNSNDANIMINVFGIVGRLAYLYSLDKKWCQDNILPFYTHSDDKIFDASWTGFAMFSGRLYEGLAMELIDIFAKTLNRIQSLSLNAKESYIHKYMLIGIHLYKNPLDEYIPNLLGYLNDSDWDVVYDRISIELGHEDIKDMMLKGWLIDFLENRIEDGNEIDFVNLIKISINHIDIFERIFHKLKNMKLNKSINDYALHIILKFKYLENHANLIAELLIFILKNNLVNDYYYVKKIKNKIKDKITDENIDNELKEECLKKQIDY